MNPSSIVALEMNFERLRPKHGYPARIIVPGLYGMFHAKWLTRIELVKGPFSGFWQQKGWTNSDLLPGGERGSIRTTAIIATPAHNSVVSGSVTIGGVAFAGDRGISLVEVSTDGGVTWMPADLDPAQSPLSWVLWTFQWTPPGGGSYRIIAKATEGTPGSPGNAQESDPAPPFPNGAAGYDSIALLVSE